MPHKLVHVETGMEISIGDTVKTFRGELATLLGFAPGHTPESSGRVQLEFLGGLRSEYYPSIIDAKVVVTPASLNTADAQVKAITREAQDAFWAVVVKHFPTATSGDLDPLRVFHLDNAMESAVREWIENNVPEVTQ